MPLVEANVPVKLVDVTPPAHAVRRFGLLDTLPVLTVMLAVLGGIWFYYHQILAINSGTFIYALDDPYIHLSLARNLAHGFYGATPFEHSSPSSSVLWPFLLAGIFKVIGVNEMVALWIQIPLCVGILVAAQWVLRDAGICNRVQQTIILFAIASLTAFLPMAFAALEHLLHCFAIILFCWTFAKVINGDTSGRFDALKVGLSAALLAGSRYEGLFTLAVAGLLALRARRWDLASAIAVGGAIPVLGFGLFSLHIGGHLLPNSLVLKAQPLTWRLDWKLRALYSEAPAILLLLVTLLAVRALEHRKGSILSRRTSTLLTLLLGTLGLHAYLGTWGWFTRYEAYLMCGGVLTLAIVLHEVFRQSTLVRGWKLAMVGLSLVFAFFAGQRAWNSTHSIALASNDIYSQQWQFARLCRQYYRGQTIAATDVGAVTYFAETDTQDVMGLMSYSLLNLGHVPGAEKIESVLAAHHTKVMAFYLFFVMPANGGMHFPASWIPVDTWDLKEKHVVWGPSVTLFAEGCENARQLSAHLAGFDPTLPKTVKATRAKTVCGQPAPQQDLLPSP